MPPEVFEGGILAADSIQEMLLECLPCTGPSAQCFGECKDMVPTPLEAQSAGGDILLVHLAVNSRNSLELV